MIIKSLTDRELEVLKLIVNGYTNLQISKLLNLKFSTIATHRANIRCKLQVNNTAELVRLAIEKGIIR